MQRDVAHKDLPAATHRAPSRILYIAMGLLASLWVVPFVNPFHWLPLPSFVEEAMAGALGLLGAALVLVLNGRRVLFPLIGLLPLGLLLALIAGAVLREQDDSALALHALYLLFATLLIWAGHALSVRLGEDRLAAAVAYASVAGGLAAAALGALSIAPDLNSPLVMQRWEGRVFGNIGQANHFSAHLWIALAGAVYLGLTARLRLAWIAAIAIPLATMSALSGSRASFVYALIIAAALAWHARANVRAQRRRGVMVLGVLAVAVLVGNALSLAPLPSVDGRPPGTALARAFAELAPERATPPIRRVMAAQSWRVVMDAPLWGAGAGQLPKAAFARSSALAGERFAEPLEHAHNLFLQLAAELGVPSALFAALMLVALAVRSWPRDARPPALLMGSIGAIIFLHSQIEYPLWYAHFLGIFALALGALETRRFEWTVPPTAGACAAVLVLMLGGGILGVLVRDFVLIRSDFDAVDRRTYLASRAIRPLDCPRAVRLLRNPCRYVAFLGAPASDLGAVDPATLRAAHLYPWREVVFKLAVAEAAAGRQAEAQRLWRNSRIAYPADHRRAAEELRYFIRRRYVPEVRLD